MEYITLVRTYKAKVLESLSSESMQGVKNSIDVLWKKKSNPPSLNISQVVMDEYFKIEVVKTYLRFVQGLCSLRAPLVQS